MLWLIYGLGTAFFEAAKDVLSKRAMRSTDPHLVAFSMPLFAFPVLLCFALTAPFPAVDGVFWIALFSASALHVCALTLYMHAIKHSPLALSLPMISFTPLFMMFFGPFVAGEQPTARGGLGVLLIVAGTYLLNVSRRSEGLLAPFQALARERGAVLMLLVAAIWGVTGLIDRIGVRHSGLELWAGALVLLTTVLFATIVAVQGGFRGQSVAGFFRSTAAPGLLNGISLLLYMLGIGQTLVAYIVSIKRLSILIGILLGYVFLGETQIRDKLIGAVVMVIGVIVISAA